MRGFVDDDPVFALGDDFDDRVLTMAWRRFQARLLNMQSHASRQKIASMRRVALVVVLLSAPPMTIADMRAKLQDKFLFAEFTEEELDEFLELLDPVSARAGEPIVRQDEMGDCMYIVLSGRARVVHHKAGRDIDLALLNPGDFFGELALVDEGPRSADVIAIEDCALLKITQAVIAAVAGVYPTAAFKLLIAIGRIMVERLRLSNQRYVDSLLFPIAGKD